MRLTNRRDFSRLAKEKKRRVGRYLCVDCRPSLNAKLGISASVRYGSAPKRNRFKRLIREAFRIAYQQLPPYEINVIPRQSAKSATAKQILFELKQLLRE